MSSPCPVMQRSLARLKCDAAPLRCHTLRPPGSKSVCMHTQVFAKNCVNSSVNTPPPKGGGFRLRLEAGLIDPSGRFSQTTLKLSSGLYGAFFVKGGAHHFVAPLFVDSFVRPAPRAFFRPDRILAVAVARSEGQGRRFFSAAEGLSLTNASTAPNCP